MRTGLRTLAKTTGRRLGFEVVPNRLASSTPAVMAATVPLAGKVATVIDVGASNGMWTRGVQPLLPEADWLLFEANPVWHDDLRAFEQSSPKVHAEYVAASDHDGHIYFSVNPDNPQGGGASAEPLAEHNESLPCKSIDQAVKERGLTGPFFLKMDTQGHELQVLAGAAHVLSDATLVVMEVYGIDSPDRPTFDEICAHMRGLGFRVAGIADVLRRPKDGMFWQADMHFLRADHPAFAIGTYRGA